MLRHVSHSLSLPLSFLFPLFSPLHTRQTSLIFFSSFSFLPSSPLFTHTPLISLRLFSSLHFSPSSRNTSLPFLPFSFLPLPTTNQECDSRRNGERAQVAEIYKEEEENKMVKQIPEPFLVIFELPIACIARKSCYIARTLIEFDLG
jgi:hypothetical protein